MDTKPAFRKDHLTSIQPDLSLFDKTYDKAASAGYHLSLFISPDELIFTVLDLGNNKYIGLEQFPLKDEDSPDQWSSLLNQSQVLGGDFRSVSVSFSHHYKSVLIPSPLFHNESMEEYLDFSAETGRQVKVAYDEVSAISACNVYGVPQISLNALEKVFPKIRVNHASSVLVQTLALFNKNKADKQLFIHFESSTFQIMVLENKKLLFFNSFSFHTKEDVVYYLLFALEQLQINPENSLITLFGEISESSDIPVFIGKYIQKVKFAGRLPNFDYSDSFSKLPPQRFYLLFSQYMCV